MKSCGVLAGARAGGMPAVVSWWLLTISLSEILLETPGSCLVQSVSGEGLVKPAFCCTKAEDNGGIILPARYGQCHSYRLSLNEAMNRRLGANKSRRPGQGRVGSLRRLHVSPCALAEREECTIGTTIHPSNSMDMHTSKLLLPITTLVCNDSVSAR